MDNMLTGLMKATCTDDVNDVKGVDSMNQSSTFISMNKVVLPHGTVNNKHRPAKASKSTMTELNPMDVPSAVCEGMLQLKEKGILCDVKLVASDDIDDLEPLNVHSIVLAAGCEFFYDIFISMDTFEFGQIFQIDGIDGYTLRTAVDFLYGVAIESEDELNLLEKGATLLNIKQAKKYLIAQRERKKNTPLVIKCPTLQIPVRKPKKPYSGDVLTVEMIRKIHNVCLLCNTSFSKCDSLTKHMCDEHDIKISNKQQASAQYEKHDDDDKMVSKILNFTEISSKPADKKSLHEESVDVFLTNVPTKVHDFTDPITSEPIACDPITCVKPVDTAKPVHLNDPSSDDDNKEDVMPLDPLSTVEQYYNTDVNPLPLLEVKQEKLMIELDDEYVFNLAGVQYLRYHSTEFALGKHIWLCHNSVVETDIQGYYICTICSQKCTRDDYLIHLKKHKEKLIPLKKTDLCQICINHRKLRNNEVNNFKLLVHLYVAHATDRYFLCTVCGRTKRREVTIVKHMTGEHGIQGTYVQLRTLQLILTPKAVNNIPDLYKSLELYTSEGEKSDWISNWCRNQFHCFYCNTEFSNQKSLIEHVKNHLLTVSENILNQSHMEEEFVLKVRNYYMDKKHKDHVSQDQYECLMCTEIFESESHLTLLSKMASMKVDQPLFYCTICKNCVVMKTTLIAHIRNIHMVHSHDIICDQCGKSFKSQLYLKNHKLTHRSKAERDLDRKYCCTICDYRSFTKYNLIGHYAKHDDKKPYLCNICGVTLKSVISLKKHHETHIPKECPRCPFKATSYDMREHLKTVHPDYVPPPSKRRYVKPYPKYSCTECDFTTPKECYLARHLKTHTLVECNICGLMSKNLTSLEQHQRIHLQKMCTQCEFVGIEVDMKKHMKEYHDEGSNEVIRKYVCTVCGRAYKAQSGLSFHKRSHRTPSHICSVCGYHTISDFLLRTHLLSHQTGKEFECVICGNSYKRRAALIVHLKKHTSGKLYTRPHVMRKIEGKRKNNKKLDWSRYYDYHLERK